MGWYGVAWDGMGCYRIGLMPTAHGPRPTTRVCCFRRPNFYFIYLFLFYFLCILFPVAAFEFGFGFGLPTAAKPEIYVLKAR